MIERHPRIIALSILAGGTIGAALYAGRDVVGYPAIPQTQRAVVFDDCPRRTQSLRAAWRPPVEQGGGPLEHTHRQLEDRLDVGQTDREPKQAPSRTGGPRIVGSPEFVAAITRALQQIERRAGPETRRYVANFRSISESTQRGSGKLAEVLARSCNATVFPGGWRRSETWTVRVLAHEGYHCELDRTGHQYESANHIGFEVVEQQAAAEVLGAARTASNR